MKTCIRAVILPDGSLMPSPQGPVETFIEVHSAEGGGSYATVSFGGFIQASANFDESGCRFINYSILNVAGGMDLQRSVERLLKFYTNQPF